MSALFRALQYLFVIAFGILIFFAWYCFFCIYLFDVKILTFVVSLITVEFAFLFTFIYPIVYWFNHSVDYKIYQICMYAIYSLLCAGVFSLVASWFEAMKKK